MSPEAVRTTLRRRWYIWGSLMLVYIIGCFHRVAPAVIAGDLMKTFQTTGAALGGLSSAYFYIYAFMQIPSGILSDTLGPRFTATLGALVMGLGTLIFASAQSLFVCYTGRFMVGLGASVFMISVMRTCVEWYRPDEMGFMTGMTTTISGVGGLLAATPLALLVAYVGWRASLFLIGIASILLAWNCWFAVRNRPFDCGLPPVSPRVPVESDATGSLSQIGRGLVAIFRNPFTWPPFFGFLSLYSSLIAFLGLWGIPYLTHVYGLSAERAANYMVAVTVGLILGCPIVGRLSDRILVRRRLPYAGFALLYALTWAAFCFWNGGRPPLAFMYPLCFLMGFFCSGFILSMVCSKEVNPLGLSGIAMGTVNTSGFLGAAILQPLLGKVLDMNWDGVVMNGVRLYPLHAYRSAFLVCFYIALAGVAATVLVKETRCRNVEEQL